MFNYAATPLAPPVIKCQIHEKPNERKSWAPHSVDGFYLEPAMQYCRCFKVFVTKTNAQCISDTVEFFPTKIHMPETSTLEQIKRSVNDLLHVLRNPQPKTTFLDFGSTQTNALKHLAELFPQNLAKNRPYTPLESTNSVLRVENHTPTISLPIPTHA